MWPLTVLKICLLRADPQNLPTSTVLAVFAVVTYYVSDVMVALITVSLTQALQAAAVDTLLLVALAQTALNLSRLNERLRQTVLALTGCGALLGAVTALIAGLLPEGISPLFLWALSTVWMFAIYGHILRHALNVPYGAGIAATGVYFFLSLLLTTPFLITPEAG